MRDSTGETPLFLAAENGHSKVGKLILKHEANADYLDMSEPVHIACANGHSKVVTEASFVHVQKTYG